jgi:predicted nuclease of predicted toxin-antitoxin system
MYFLADEGVDAPIVNHLRWLGHDVLYVAELDPGITDAEVLSLAAKDKRIVITCDKDFGELVYRLKQVHSGVILLRIMELKSNEKIALLSQLIKDHGEQLINHFSVVSPRATRIRNLSFFL